MRAMAFLSVILKSFSAGAMKGIVLSESIPLKLGTQLPARAGYKNLSSFHADPKI
jgi:hypothetical protein